MIVTLDFVCLRIDLATNTPQVLLHRRDAGPAVGSFALVGGWVWEAARSDNGTCDRTLNDAVCRIMQSKVGLMPSYVQQVQVEGSLVRDSSLGWSVTIPHLCLFNRWDAETLQHQDGIQWTPLRAILDGSQSLPFDHQKLVSNAYEVFLNKIRYSSLLLYLLPAKVVISQIVDAYALFGIEVTKQTVFSRWVSTGLLIETGEKRAVNQKGPASRLYQLAENSLSYFDSAIGKPHMGPVLNTDKAFRV